MILLTNKRNWVFSTTSTYRYRDRYARYSTLQQDLFVPVVWMLQQDFDTLQCHRKTPTIPLAYLKWD